MVSRVTLHWEVALAWKVYNEWSSINLHHDNTQVRLSRAYMVAAMVTQDNKFIGCDEADGA